MAVSNKQSCVYKPHLWRYILSIIGCDGTQLLAKLCFPVPTKTLEILQQRNVSETKRGGKGREFQVSTERDGRYIQRSGAAEFFPFSPSQFLQSHPGFSVRIAIKTTKSAFDCCLEMRLAQNLHRFV